MDRSRYSNVSLSNATYEVLKKLSHKLLPGNTSLSLSKNSRDACAGENATNNKSKWRI